MSRFGWWWVSAVHDPPEAYRSSFRSAVDSVQHDPQVQALLQTWCAESTGVIQAHEPGHGRPLHLAAPASRLEELAWRTHLDEALVTSLSSEVLGHDDRSLQTFVGTRKLSPFSCLLYGIGPTGADALPGFLGNMLLAADELLAVLPAIEGVLVPSPDEREKVLGRMAAWLAVVGDAADTDPAEILDALPVMAERAAQRTMGLLAVRTDL